MTDINENIRRSGKKSLSVCSLSSHTDCRLGAVVADQERRAGAMEMKEGSRDSYINGNISDMHKCCHL